MNLGLVRFNENATVVLMAPWAQDQSGREGDVKKYITCFAEPLTFGALVSQNIAVRVFIYQMILSTVPERFRFITFNVFRVQDFCESFLFPILATTA